MDSCGFLDVLVAVRNSRRQANGLMNTVLCPALVFDQLKVEEAKTFAGGSHQLAMAYPAK
jgi:hypothetical protein